MLSITLVSGLAWSKESSECKQTVGEDLNLPSDVLEYLRSHLKDHKLVDRKECALEVFWVAIPTSQPTHEPRMVGQGQLVVLNTKTREIRVFEGQ